MNTRPAAVADMFYTGNGGQLAAQVSDFMEVEQDNRLKPKALIVPHAGFIYSGATAGHGYALVKKLAGVVKKIVLIGPCHRVWVKGLAIPGCQYFETPLGKVEIDSNSLAALAKFPQVVISNEAHQQEHSIEVQLPFLQSIFPQFQLIPMVIGEITSEALAEVLEFLWGGEETLIVISSDLSHFLDYDAAIAIDAKTSHAIENFDSDSISPEMACGSAGIKALLQVAKTKNLQVKTIQQCNSGDTAGSKDRVVGYGTYAIY
jgi:AmmeMemoRadiSam system protein B